MAMALRMMEGKWLKKSFLKSEIWSKWEEIHVATLTVVCLRKRQQIERLGQKSIWGSGRMSVRLEKNERSGKKGH